MDIEAGDAFDIQSSKLGKSNMMNGNGGGSSRSDDNVNANDRLLADYDHLQLTDDRLARTQRLASEAEQIGASVLSDLRRQREQLDRAHRSMQHAEADLDESNQIIARMIRRAKANRMATTAIVVCLFILILLILVNKFF